MEIDLKTARILAKRYLGGTVVVILLFSGTLWKFLDENKQLDEKREALDVQEQKFSQAQIDFEKYRSNNEILINQKKQDIERREFIVNQLEKENQSKSEAIQQRAKQYSDAFDKIQTERVTLGAAGQQKAEDDHINQLISDFSAIGVNLNDPINCKDKDAVFRYNKAKANFDEIVGFAYAHKLDKKYDVFINGQSGIFDMSCRPSVVTE
ncbi:hypothetical protein [Paraburkholderia lacunae]|nr:hypothetical protein [Paraburkholderia lacunae]